MFIAASTRSLWEMPYREAAEALQHAGFDKLEIWINEEIGQLKPSDIVKDVDAAAFTIRDSGRIAPCAVFLDAQVDETTFDAVLAFLKQLRIAQLTILAAEPGTPFNTEIDRLRDINKKCQAESIRVTLLTKSGTLTEDPHTASEICQAVKGLGLTLDPSYYLCTGRGSIEHDFVYPHVNHVQLRDSTEKEIQVPAGLGEMDYAKIFNSLENVGYARGLSVDLLPRSFEGEERLLELRKLRMLLESLL